MNAISEIAKLHPETGGLGGDCCSGCGMLAPCPTRRLCDEALGEVAYMRRQRDLDAAAADETADNLHAEWKAYEADRDRWKADADRLAARLRNIVRQRETDGYEADAVALAAHDALMGEIGATA